MLELIDINYKVKNKIILENVNLKIDTSEILAITGSNGSGKSTLLKIIMGIIKPTSGKIIFDGQDITNLKINERAKLGLTYSYQSPVSFKGLTVFDLLMIANGNYPTYLEMKESLGGVGLCARDYIDREVDSSLSGGELKRIEIALAIIKKGKQIMLDEPEAGIDLWSFDSLIKTLENVNKKNKISLIIVTHQEKLLKIADKILILNGGKILDYGQKKTIIKRLKNQKCDECKGV